MKHTKTKIFQIGVFGSGTINSKTYRLAYEVGKEIARSKNILVNGGLSGVMEASAKGARGTKGLVIGILPGSDFRDGNNFSTVKILTGMQFARNQITSLSCHGAIVVGGSSGAYEEARRVWEGRGPVVVIKDIGSKTGAAHTLIERENNFGLAFPEEKQKPYHIFIEDSPKNAVKKIISLIKQGYPKKS